jgi:hypothetical protein
MTILLRKPCATDERYILGLTQESDETEVLGSFKRPFPVFVKDIKAVLSKPLHIPSHDSTMKKLMGMFQSRYVKL